jgi:hypothetical protein
MLSDLSKKGGETDRRTRSVFKPWYCVAPLLNGLFNALGFIKKKEGVVGGTLVPLLLKWTFII